tara:strand:- start:909 stop:1646 length:738 start_codon:yes stop_codon:yes gene_type:complete
MIIIILAAGKGTRMRSETAKVLHILHGKPLLKYVIDLAYKIKPDRIFVVVGFQKEEVKKNFVSENIEFIDQEEQLGTGHAVMQTKSFLANFKGDVLVLSGDVPFLKESTVNEMIRNHRSNNAAVTILTAEKDNPTGYGRIIRNSNNYIERIVEETDCSKTERTINEINSGIYCFNKKFLLESLEEIDQNNVQHEYYLTDIVKIAFDNSLLVMSAKVPNPDEINGINTIKDLVEAEKFLEDQIRNP